MESKTSSVGLGNYLGDDDFDWSVMTLIDTSPTNKRQKRKALSKLLSPNNIRQALDETVDKDSSDSGSNHDNSDAEDDVKESSVSPSTLDALKATRRIPLKATRRTSVRDIGLSLKSLELNPPGVSEEVPKKRQVLGKDDFESPTKLGAGKSGEKYASEVWDESQSEVLIIPDPQFPTVGEQFRTPVKAKRFTKGSLGPKQGNQGEGTP